MDDNDIKAHLAELEAKIAFLEAANDDLDQAL